ncbi:hypothetical protein GJ744_002762 [Endocarpon pusillum]|uniref:Uncharacterized protein n=1 Tax=Endocarpon pusillum TaxID=364733 RepID=A0A8H7E6A4_9EURO|nr:hypothetical protein GJ744_002762 [Endocarpon pusillum]
MRESYEPNKLTLTCSRQWRPHLHGDIRLLYKIPNLDSLSLLLGDMVPSPPVPHPITRRKADISSTQKIFPSFPTTESPPASHIRLLFNIADDQSKNLRSRVAVILQKKATDSCLQIFYSSIPLPVETQSSTRFR